MNDKQKASAVLNYLEGHDSATVINILNSLLKDEQLADLYDKMKADGIDIDGSDDEEDDDTPEEMKAALDYVREQLDEDELTIYKATVSKNLNQRMDASTGLDDCKIIDLLEEYGENEEMPEGWWEEFGEIDDWLLKL